MRNKLFILPAMAMLFACSASGQTASEPQTDLEIKGLKGNVKELSEESSMTFEWYSSEDIISYNYNDKGMLQAINYFMKDEYGDHTGTVEFVYDEQGRLARRKVTITGSANFEGFSQNADETFKYDDKGQLSQIIGADGQPTVTFTYNNKGQLVKKEDASYGTETYSYDGKGNLAEKKAYSTITYTYDDQNRKIAYKDSEGGNGTYKYNEQGDLVEEYSSYYSEMDGMDVEDTIACTYQYDGQGNWIKRTMTGSDRKQTTVRKIKYY